MKTISLCGCFFLNHFVLVAVAVAVFSVGVIVKFLCLSSGMGLKVYGVSSFRFQVSSWFRCKVVFRLKM